MSARYASALEQIREILTSRSQAEPLLEAEQIWELLNCYPVPSVRTIQRYVEDIRNGGGFGAERQTVAIDVRRQTLPHEV